MRAGHPEEFEVLVRGVEWKLLEMLLERLQRIGNQEEPFIYTLGWERSPSESAVKTGVFDGRLHLLPGAGDNMLRAAPLLRPLVQRSWTLTVGRSTRCKKPSSRTSFSAQSGFR